MTNPTDFGETSQNPMKCGTILTVCPGYVIVVLYLPFSLSNPSIIVKSVSITGMEHSEVPLNNDFICFDILVKKR